jgi:hypothetical protein
MEKTIDRIIYVDLDGVLIDWIGGYKKISGGLTPDEFESKHGKKSSFDLVKQYGVKWWAELEWLSDGKELWDYVYNNFLICKILTATGKPGEWSSIARKGKHMWLDANLKNVHVSDRIIVGSKSEKKQYARPGDILIDDTLVNITDWNGVGGIGILHKNSRSTINHLKEFV